MMDQEKIFRLAEIEFQRLVGFRGSPPNDFFVGDFFEYMLPELLDETRWRAILHRGRKLAGLPEGDLLLLISDALPRREIERSPETGPMGEFALDHYGAIVAALANAIPMVAAQIKRRSQDPDREADNEMLRKALIDIYKPNTNAHRKEVLKALDNGDDLLQNHYLMRKWRREFHDLACWSDVDKNPKLSSRFDNNSVHVEVKRRFGRRKRQ